MSEEEFIPYKSERKLANLFRVTPELRQNRALQNKIVSLIKETLQEARQEWNDIRNDTLNAIITCDRKQEAKRKALIKDEKYAPFREYFKNLQYKKFISYQKQGKNLSASAFVRYFLKSKAHVVDIPYKNSNWEIKLNQLAQANNREFKKSSCMM